MTSCNKKSGSPDEQPAVVVSSQEVDSIQSPNVPKPDGNPLLPDQANEGKPGPQAAEDVVAAVSTPAGASLELIDSEGYGPYLPGSTKTIQVRANETISVAAFLLNEGQSCDASTTQDELEAITGEGNDLSLAIIFPSSGLKLICIRALFSGETLYQSLPVAAVVLPEGMEVWYRSDAGVTLVDGRVSQWQDQSGNMRHLSVGSADQQPRVDQASHQLAMVDFDGVDDRLLGDATLDVQTVIAVHRVDDSQNSSLLGQIWGSYSEGVHIATDPRDTNHGISFDGSSSHSARYAVDDLTSLSSSYVTHLTPAPWEYNKIHYTLAEYGSAYSITSQSMAQLTAGGSSEHFYGGQIGELLAFSRALSLEDRQALDRYLRLRWKEDTSLAPIDPLSLDFQQLPLGLRIQWQVAEGQGATYHTISYQANTAPASCQQGQQISSGAIGLNQSYLLQGLELGTYGFRICGFNIATGASSDGITGSFTVNEVEAKAPPADGLVHWLKPGVSSANIDSSNRVSQISDLGSASAHLGQATLGSQPLIEASGPQGQSMLVFDGVDDYLESSQGLVARTVIAVFRVNSTGQDSQDLGQIWGHYSDGAHVACENRSSQPYLGFSFDGSSSTKARYQLQNDTSFTNFFENGNSSPWAYDTLELVIAEFDAGKTISGITMGHLGSGFAVGSHHFAGAIGEVLVYDRVLTESELQSLRDYLTENWFL